MKKGAQIDLIIDRSDKTINLCEMKYAQGEYEITKDYDAYMQQRTNVFRKVTGTRKTLVPIYITPFGLTNNMYSRRLPRQVTVNALF